MNNPSKYWSEKKSESSMICLLHVFQFNNRTGVFPQR